MKIVIFPGTDTAINTRWITAIKNHPNPVDYEKKPLPPYVEVNFSYGVQQGSVRLCDASLEDVVAMCSENR